MRILPQLGGGQRAVGIHPPTQVVVRPLDLVEKKTFLNIYISPLDTYLVYYVTRIFKQFQIRRRLSVWMDVFFSNLQPDTPLLYKIITINCVL